MSGVEISSARLRDLHFDVGSFKETEITFSDFRGTKIYGTGRIGFAWSNLTNARIEIPAAFLASNLTNARINPIEETYIREMTAPAKNYFRADAPPRCPIEGEPHNYRVCGDAFLEKMDICNVPALSGETRQFPDFEFEPLTVGNNMCAERWRGFESSWVSLNTAKRLYPDAYDPVLSEDRLPMLPIAPDDLGLSPSVGDD
jgi:hypothetical protein